MSQATVVVFARDPVPGETKTRLVPALGPDSAADLYRCFLRDRLEQIAAIDGIRRVVAFTPDDADLTGLAPPGFEFVPQGGGDLTDRLIRAAQAAHTDGGGPVVLMDSDSPTLPPAYVREALRSLGGDYAADCVVGPAEDGGYYLIGLTRPEPELFQGIPWSTSGVLSATLAKAKEAGLSVRVLPSWWDVDEPADLDRLRASLHAAAWPPRTAEWLRELPLPRPSAGKTNPGPEDPWRKEQSRLVYGNRWIRVREDRVLMPNGVYTAYGVVEASRAVGVLPFLDRDTVLMVRQFRYVSGRTTWEMPTGAAEPGEDLVAAARRELREEAGYDARKLTPLGEFVSSKSVVDEQITLYLGEDLVPAPDAVADDTEFISVHEVSFAEVLERVLGGEIEDAMTVIAVLRVALIRRA